MEFKVDNYFNQLTIIKNKYKDNVNYKDIKARTDKLEKIFQEFKSVLNTIKTKDTSSVSKFKDWKSQMSDSFDSAITGSNRDKPKTKEEKPLTRQEYDLRKEQILKGKIYLISEGDEIFDQIRGTAKRIKTGAVMIRDEMQLHEPLMSDLEKNIDKVEGKMKRADNKLANYLAKSSNNCLYWTILIEFVLLLLFFMM